MSYCSDAWISDYNYELVVDHREGLAKSANVVGAELEPCWLIWGRISGDEVILEPVAEIMSHANIPQGGENHLELRSSDSVEQLSLQFEAQSVAHPQGREEAHFAFLVPSSAFAGKTLGSVHVRSPQSEAVRFSTARKSVAAARVLAAGVDRVMLQWDAASQPLAVIQDADTGRVLSLAQGGRVELSSDAQRFSVSLSDGVATERVEFSIR
jgi:hypothetical protein